MLLSFEPSHADRRRYLSAVVGNGNRRGRVRHERQRREPTINCPPQVATGRALVAKTKRAANLLRFLVSHRRQPQRVADRETEQLKVSELNEAVF